MTTNKPNQNTKAYYGYFSESEETRLHGGVIFEMRDNPKICVKITMIQDMTGEFKEIKGHEYIGVVTKCIARYRTDEPTGAEVV
jgi:hypothetical protein